MCFFQKIKNKNNKKNKKIQIFLRVLVKKTKTTSLIHVMSEQLGGGGPWHTQHIFVCFHTSDSLRSVCTCKVRLAVPNIFILDMSSLSGERERELGRSLAFLSLLGMEDGREKVTPAKHPPGFSHCWGIWCVRIIGDPHSGLEKLTETEWCPLYLPE